jgi:hypothetical protein
LQRFISEDPIGLAAGDLNFYAYALNNSVNLSDPTGQFVKWFKCYRCNDVGNQIQKAEEECVKELAQCKDESDLAKFLEKYNAVWRPTALYNCVKAKTDPAIWKKFTTNCFDCGFLNNPWPRPPR